MQEEIKQGTMNCEAVSRELDAQFGFSRPKLSAAAESHLASCPACRALFAWITGGEAGPGSMADGAKASAGEGNATRRIAGTLTADLKPVKPLPSLLVSTLQLLGVFVLLMAGLIAMWTARGLISPPTWQVVAMIGVCFAGAALLAVSLARQMRPAARPILPERFCILLLGAILLGGFALLFPWNQFGAGAVSSSTFIEQSLNCFWPGVAMAVPVAILLWMVARRGVRYSLTGAGAALGALGGLFAVAGLSLSCANRDAMHLLVSHVGVLAVAAAAGALVGHFMGRFPGNSRPGPYRTA